MQNVDTDTPTTHTNMHTYKHSYVQILVRTTIRAYKYSYVQTFMRTNSNHSCVQTFMCINIHTYKQLSTTVRSIIRTYYKHLYIVQTFVRTNIRAYKHSSVQTFMSTNIHSYTHSYVRTFMPRNN